MFTSICSQGLVKRHGVAAGAAAVVVLLALFACVVRPAVSQATETGLVEGGRCATGLARSLHPILDYPTPGQGPTRATPPANPQVGDSWFWYIWRLAAMPVADWLSCTVRGMGDHCYVMVEDSQWNVNVNQAQVDHIVDRFDNTSIGPHPDLGIYDINVQTFGIPPDRLDNDDRIYIMYYDFDINADGFFWSFDEYPDGSQPWASNECEVVYINCSDNDPAGDYLIAVVAHEFEHMIHWEHDINESPWVDEGLGELAMYLYGHPDNISSFNSNPDNNLTVWNGNWADYIKTYLWSLYFYERYGGSAAIYDVVHHPLNSTQGYDAVLDLWSYTENFDDVFADWTVANYLDDPSIGDGRWGYVGDDLPAFNHSATHSTYPTSVPTAVVNYWASDYVRFLSASSGLQIDFDGYDTSAFAVWALELDPSQPTRVTRLTLDPSQMGSVTLPDVGSLYERAVMAVSHNSSLSGTTYGYQAATDVTGLAAVTPVSLRRALLEQPVPNPFNPSVKLGLELPADAASARLVVFDAAGRLVRTLVDGPIQGGQRAVYWDGRTDRATDAPSGTYFFRLEAGPEVAMTRATLVR